VCDDALKEIGMQMISSRDCALDPNPGGELVRVRVSVS